ncbi:MAG: hypothetical protein H0X25_05480 [Acidobacteriales bacterium]|nr:hypothetical protein [Terriglobales bacterium]
MRKTLSAFGLVLGFVVGSATVCPLTYAFQEAPASQTQAPASGQGMHRMSADDHLKILTEKLNLTEDQQAKLRPILSDESKQMDAIHDNPGMAPADKQAQMREVHESFAGKVDAVLTPEQREHWKQLREQMMQKHKPETQGQTTPQ